jgi:hypothetical protein
VKASTVAAGMLLFITAAPVADAAERRCPSRVQIGFGESAADIARRCGVSPEALDRANPGLSRNGERTGVTVSVPRPTLPSPSIGTISNGFAPVPTPPGALGR